VRGVSVANANANEDTEVTFVVQSSVPAGGPAEGDTYPLTYTTELIEFSVDGDTAIVRSPALEEITNELLTHLRDIDARIIAEAAARSAGDEALQEHIDTEASAREAADTTLQEHIDTEASAREAADTTLQEHIDTEASAREAADTALQGHIDNVKTDVAKVKADLQDFLEQRFAEIYKVNNAQNKRMDEEAAAREAVNTTLQNALNAESQSRDDADRQLTRSISELSSRIATLRNNIAEAAKRVVDIQDTSTQLNALISELQNLAR